MWSLSNQLLKKSKPFLNELNWNNYEKIRFVGKGAFGTAILYRRKSDDTLVILKEINMNDLTATERQLAINEVKVLSILHHPNIISYYGSFESNGELFIEMEYANAGTLANFLTSLSCPLQEHEILIIFKQIVAATVHLHENNILHRDLKTENIFLNKEGFIKVGDFGISKMLTTRCQGAANTCVGTPYYISPEICEGKAYNQKSDIWSLGCILYEMACLHKTFEGTNLPVIINKIVKGQFAPVKSNFSNAFKNLISNLLQKSPESRPSADKVLHDVNQILNKLHMDRYHLWSKNQEGRTLDCSVVDIFAREDQNNSSALYPRSVVYQMKLHKENICLSSLLFPASKRIKQISKSTSHFLALTYDSIVYAWGAGNSGQLGLGEVFEWVDKPTEVEAVRERHVVQVCAGEEFSVFVTKNGLIMSCGKGKSRCLGRIDNQNCLTPKLVEKLLSIDVVQICNGPHHVAIINGEGKAFAWGYNADGRLGVGHKDPYVDLPAEVVMPSGVVLKNVFCGADATAYIDEAGAVWLCGNNTYNKLGINEVANFRTTKIEFCTVPTKQLYLAKKYRVNSVNLGKSHSAFIVNCGEVLTIGDNSEGQLGLNHIKSVSKPTKVKQLLEHRVMKVQCGSSFTLVTTYENFIYFWGSRYVASNNSDNTSFVNKADPVAKNIIVDQFPTALHRNSDSTDKLSSGSNEAIKIGDSNHSLMNVVQDVGPDFPIVQISNPKVVINDLNDLSLLTNVNSLRREVILKAQAIVSLFASPVHLYQGEMVKLSNMYCFEDDSVFIILDTTIAIPSTNGSKVSANSSNMKHNTEIVPSQVLSPNSSTRPTSIVSDSVPEWVKEEALQSPVLRFPPMMHNVPTSPSCCNCQEVNELRRQNEILKVKISEADEMIRQQMNQIREMQEQINRIKSKSNFKLSFKKCTIM